MNDSYFLLKDPVAEFDIPDEGILSKVLFTDERCRATLFAMSAGQELSEHATPKEAFVQILDGEATLTVGDDTHEVSGGAWLQMTPGLKHSLRATTDLRFLLTILR